MSIANPRLILSFKPRPSFFPRPGTQLKRNFLELPLPSPGRSVPFLLFLSISTKAWARKSHRTNCPLHRYKGMGQSTQIPSASSRNITPQATGFSQIVSRGGGEGGGQAMSVLLSWHEKVSQHHIFSYPNLIAVCCSHGISTPYTPDYANDASARSLWK